MLALTKIGNKMFMYLGIDLGTSSVKVILLNEDDSIVAQASSSLQVSRPKPLWSEQNPQDWWQATNLAMAKLKTTYANELKAVKAIGLSGQMHGATVLDKNNQVLRPAILWNDGRSQQQCLEIELRLPSSREITGNIAMPGFTAPKLLWLQQNEPELFNQIDTVLLPKDYLRLLMTGEKASDMSDSAGTLWLDVANRKWSEEMLAVTGLTLSQMPALFEGTEVTGTLLAEVADAWGMSKVPVAAGAGDNAAGAVGIGVINPNEAFLSLGTSGVYFVANERYQPNPSGAVHAFCHCIPNTWHQMSVVLSAASCLAWVTQLTKADNEQALLDEVAQEDFSKPCNVMFLPYLSGERTPHNNPNAKGVLLGLTHSSTRAEIGRAVLEGVAFAFSDAQQVLFDAGTKIDSVSVIGGGARSVLWGKILASVLGQTLTYREGSEVGPAYGAARLAKMSVTNVSPTQICLPGKIIQSIDCDSTMSGYYIEQHQKFQAVYRSLVEHF